MPWSCVPCVLCIPHPVTWSLTSTITWLLNHSLIFRVLCAPHFENTWTIWNAYLQWKPRNVCRKHHNQRILLSGKLFLRVHNWYWAQVVLCVRIASCAGKICIHLLQWVCTNVTSSLLIQMESQGKNGREAWMFTCVNCIHRRMVFQEVHKEVPQTLGEQPKLKLGSRRGYRAP